MMRVVTPILLAFLSTTAYAQTDPGPRTGPAGAGGSLAGIDQTYFNTLRNTFQEIDTVPTGLGPRFNMDSCGGCHAQPDVGGSSPATNPQIAVATKDGATNKIPSFISIHSPVREARFISDGGVHDLFTITGRSDALGCTLRQPDFNKELAANNIIFRIPTPTFGAGLVEATPDDNLQDAFDKQHKHPGVAGHFNRTGNDGTITRFGWKAQNKSLLIFAGEAYNVEQGVTNENFPNERDDTEGCQFNATPEDHTTQESQSDITSFALFMQMLAPPTPVQAPGAGIFKAVGCTSCHIETQTTGKMSLTGASKVTYHPFSDFAVHNMGQGLADDISQGNANGNEFRTAPLWGVGQRLFFLHDGRTNNLVEAIQAHASAGSEANTVINAYNSLPATQKQNLINYLRSL